MFVFAQPARSKRAMLADLNETPAQAKLTARNTLDYTMENGLRRVRLHETDILTFRPNMITLNTGGYNTKTTRERMNDALRPFKIQVFTHKGIIHARTEFGTFKFKDELTIDLKRKKVTGAMTDEAAKKLDKAISAYLAKYKKTGIPKLIEKSAGDPWVFPDKYGKIDAHIVKDWIKTGYVHMRMVGLALEFAGLRDPAMYIRLTGAKWDAMMTRRVRRYVRACLGLES